MDYMEERKKRIELKRQELEEKNRSSAQRSSHFTQSELVEYREKSFIKSAEKK
jgi:hypothetical protein